MKRKQKRYERLKTGTKKKMRNRKNRHEQKIFEERENG